MTKTIMKYYKCKSRPVMLGGLIGLCIFVQAKAKSLSFISFQVITIYIHVSLSMYLICNISLKLIKRINVFFLLAQMNKRVTLRHLDVNEAMFKHIMSHYSKTVQAYILILPKEFY